MAAARPRLPFTAAAETPPPCVIWQVRAKYCWPGNQMFPQLDEELHFGFQKNGSLVVARCEEDVALLHELMERGRKNGVQNMRIVEREELLQLEPSIDPKVPTRPKPGPRPNPYLHPTPAPSRPQALNAHSHPDPTPESRRSPRCSRPTRAPSPRMSSPSPSPRTQSTTASRHAHHVATAEIPPCHDGQPPRPLAFHGRCARGARWSRSIAPRRRAASLRSLSLR